MLHNSFFWLRNNSFFFFLETNTHTRKRKKDSNTKAHHNSFVSYVGYVRVHPYLPTKKRVHPCSDFILFYFSIYIFFIGWVSAVFFTKKGRNKKKQVQFDLIYFWSDTLFKLLSKIIFRFRTIIHSFHFISLYHSEIGNIYFIGWVIYFCTILYMSLFLSLSLSLSLDFVCK